jgi:transposase InsO family protein
MTTAKTTLFFRLNMLLNEQEAINELCRYLTNKPYPERFPDEDQRKRYDRKFTKFKKEGNNIVYQLLKLKVIDKNRVEATLKSEFSSNGLGKGAVALYKHIRTKYIGIGREDDQAFLSQNVQYQLAKPKRHRVNKPILASNVGELFSIDLIDMSLMKKNSQGFRYIFSCIDVFSRHVFLEAIRRKTALATKAALVKIINKGEVKPRSILLDNGAEFKGSFQSYCETEDITLRHTKTYTPQANGIVERLNKEVRKVLKQIHVKDQTLVWHTKLDEVATAKNTTYHGST